MSIASGLNINVRIDTFFGGVIVEACDDRAEPEIGLQKTKEGQMERKVFLLVRSEHEYCGDGHDNVVAAFTSKLAAETALAQVRKNHDEKSYSEIWEYTLRDSLGVKPAPYPIGYTLEFTAQVIMRDSIAEPTAGWVIDDSLSGNEEYAAVRLSMSRVLDLGLIPPVDQFRPQGVQLGDDPVKVRFWATVTEHRVNGIEDGEWLTHSVFKCHPVQE
jgi:hypothetical protein